ncbi:MAG: cobyrinate a,c-diamide synthase, partial [Pseudomonadota bacterium]|nr:cobyrinate a,c-diamide synthase [Pseudomonadota bacterium]
LALASAAPVHQLDLWMTGEADCARRLHEAAQEADLIIVEGVMGLFDGLPSAADLAQHFSLPVLTVIDAGAMAGTFGALAWGLQSYRDGLRFAGVLANRVASEGHAAMLEESLRDPAQWQGALMRSPAFNLPERHLGLVMSGEMDDAMARLDAAADALAATKLGQMDTNALQAWAVGFPGPDDAAPETPQLLQGVTVAVARDAAFCFIYAANLDCLRALGAHVVFFSPLRDTALPDCDALWLPGGYPELHAAALAENSAMKAAVASHVAAGKPVWAECGGMMALFGELQTIDDSRFAMWAILPGRASMQKKLAALGPQQLTMAGGTLRGHTFHYSTCETSLAPAARTEAAPGRKLRGQGEALYVAGPDRKVKASYFHAWFPSNPAAAAALFIKERL